MEYINPSLVLYDIARQIEREYGRKDIAMDIRRCAKRVCELEEARLTEMFDEHKTTEWRLVRTQNV